VCLNRWHEWSVRRTEQCGWGVRRMAWHGWDLRRSQKPELVLQRHGALLKEVRVIDLAYK